MSWYCFLYFLLLPFHLGLDLPIGKSRKVCYNNNRSENRLRHPTL